MKAVRAYEHDIDAIAEMHKRRPFVFTKLLARFDDEMGHVIAKVGGAREIREN